MPDNLATVIQIDIEIVQKGSKGIRPKYLTLFRKTMYHPIDIFATKIFVSRRVSKIIYSNRLNKRYVNSLPEPQTSYCTMIYFNY